MTGQKVESIPFSAYPGPVFAYSSEDDEPRITATNESFETLFPALSSGTPVTSLFDSFSAVKSRGKEGPVSRIARGDAVSIYVDDSGNLGPYRIRVLPTDDDTGYVVFSAVDGYPDSSDTFAVSWASSVISHDLRNSLDVAKAHLQAAEETGDPEHFETIATAHDRMEQIVSDVLTITRDETTVAPSEQVSIGNTARAAWQAVDTGGATLNIGTGLPTVTADADRLRRVFENLFRNSVEHGSMARGSEGDGSAEDTDSQSDAGQGGATADTQVTVTVGPLESGFYVADDGVGIPPDEQENVTEPGYSSRANGTGLGLAIVEQIVAAHGWELTVTSATDGGAQFEIRF